MSGPIKLVAELLEFVEHDEHCPTENTNDRRDCRCGLRELIERAEAALNAQERAAEPAEEAPIYIPPAEMAKLQAQRTADLSAAMDRITAANAPAAAPWEWTKDDEAWVRAWEVDRRTTTGYGARLLRTALAHIDALHRALDMQRQATEEAVRRAEAVRADFALLRESKQREQGERVQAVEFLRKIGWCSVENEALALDLKRQARALVEPWKCPVCGGEQPAHGPGSHLPGCEWAARERPGLDCAEQEGAKP